MSVSIYKKLIAYKKRRGFSSAVYLPVGKLVSSGQHPRKVYTRSSLEALAESIKEYGVVTPLIVCRGEQGGDYTVIAGERRLRAAVMAGLSKVPAVVTAMDKAEALVFSVMENVQREGLYFFNEADAYHSYICEHGGELDRLAALVGRTPQYVADKIKMLGLYERTRDIIFYNRLTEKHAHVLLRITDEEMQAEAAQMIADQGLNARKAEAVVDTLLSGATADDAVDAADEPELFGGEYFGGYDECSGECSGRYADGIRRDIKDGNSRGESLFRGCIRDTRVIENTIRQTADIIRKQKIGTVMLKTEDDEYIDFTIRVKKQ